MDLSVRIESPLPTLTLHRSTAAVAIVVYVVAAVLLEWASNSAEVVGVWRPSAGLGVFLLLRLGLRIWPAVFVGTAAAAVVNAPADAAPGLLALAAATSTAAYVAMAHLLEQRGIESTRGLAAFVRVVVPATAALGVALTALPALAGTASLADVPARTLHAWLAELNGIAVLLPLLLGVGPAPVARRRPPAPIVAEAAVQAVTIAAVLAAVFAVSEAYDVRFFSLLFLPLIWVAARWGLPGTTLALLAYAAGLVLAAQHVTIRPATMVQLQILLLALCATGLTLGALVTQRRRVERDLRQKQVALNHALQQAAAGEMTSALAHELSQPIAALARYVGACELLARGGAADAEVLRETLRKAAGETHRAGEVIRRLRDFYRAGAVEVASVAPRALVEAVVRAVRARAERIEAAIDVREREPVPEVAVDALQIETALQNVLQNAVDAVRTTAESRAIEVTIGIVDGLVALEVRDHGPGVSPDVRDRLFEPFTTTKADGMGMGLAISRSLVRANGGDIRVERTALGAAFTILLPPVTAPVVR